MFYDSSTTGFEFCLNRTVNISFGQNQLKITSPLEMDYKLEIDYSNLNSENFGFMGIGNFEIHREKGAPLHPFSLDISNYKPIYTAVAPLSLNVVSSVDNENDNAKVLATRDFKITKSGDWEGVAKDSFQFTIAVDPTIFNVESSSIEDVATVTRTTSSSNPIFGGSDSGSGNSGGGGGSNNKTGMIIGIVVACVVVVAAAIIITVVVIRKRKRVNPEQNSP